MKTFPYLMGITPLLVKVFFSSKKCKLRSVFADKHKMYYPFLFPLELLSITIKSLRLFPLLKPTIGNFRKNLTMWYIGS